MIHSLATIFTDLGLVFLRNRKIKRPWALLGHYLRFRIKLILRPTAQSERFFGYRIHFPNYQLFYGLWYEIFLKEVYSLSLSLSLLNPSPRIIDAGSNIGMSILFFKYAYPSAKIVGVEASASMFAWLQRNISENRLDKDVQIFNVALAGRKGKTRFYANDKNLGGGSIYAALWDGSETTTNTEVETVQLSELLREKIDLIKIDIEGAEFEVIEEARKKLNSIDMLVLEIHQIPTSSNDKFYELLSVLDENNFLYTIIGSSSITTADYSPATRYNITIAAKKAA